MSSINFRIKNMSEAIEKYSIWYHKVIYTLS